MLNVVVHFPVDGARFNSDVVSHKFPETIKRKIIEGSENFFNDRNVSVMVIPVDGNVAVNQIIFAAIYCDERIKNSTGEIAKLFHKLIDSALLSCADGKKVSVHLIFSDWSRTIVS